MKNIIDIHGQYDNQTLMDTEFHTKYLDKFIGTRIAEIHKKYSEKIIKSSLYQLPSGHALIFTIGYARSTVAKKDLLKTCATDNVIINKIKEYSPLLSSTPFEKLNYFS